MGTPKNIIISLLLCCVMIDPVAATFTWLHFRKTIVKKEVTRHINAGIDKDDLVLLKFSQEETRAKLRWEHPEEFEYNRQMYDVVARITLGDTVYFWCWLDHKETKLNSRLDELSAKTLKEDRKIRDKYQSLIPFFKLLYCPVSFSWNGTMPQSLCERFSFISDFYASITIPPPTPPPQPV